MSAPLPLAGRRALVTGGGRGIGAAVGRLLAEAGCDVAVLTQHQTSAETGAGLVRSRGARGLALVADMAEEEQVRAAVSQLEAAWGGLEILVNNAGWTKHSYFVSEDAAYWRRLIDVNLMGVLYATHAALPLLTRAAGDRAIVNVASDAARVGTAKEAVYSAAKGGVVSFTRSLAREQARAGIRVNCVCPGLTTTDLTETLRLDPADARMLEQITAAIPLKRASQPAEVAEVIRFLCTPAAGYITGQVWSASGGLTML